MEPGKSSFRKFYAEAARFFADLRASAANGFAPFKRFIDRFWLTRNVYSDICWILRAPFRVLWFLIRVAVFVATSLWRFARWAARLGAAAGRVIFAFLAAVLVRLWRIAKWVARLGAAAGGRIAAALFHAAKVLFRASIRLGVFLFGLLAGVSKFLFRVSAAVINAAVFVILFAVVVAISAAVWVVCIAAKACFGIARAAFRLCGAARFLLIRIRPFAEAALDAVLLSCSSVLIFVSHFSLLFISMLTFIYAIPCKAALPAWIAGINVYVRNRGRIRGNGIYGKVYAAVRVFYYIAAVIACSGSLVFVYLIFGPMLVVIPAAAAAYLLAGTRGGGVWPARICFYAALCAVAGVVLYNGVDTIVIAVVMSVLLFVAGAELRGVGAVYSRLSVALFFPGIAVAALIIVFFYGIGKAPPEWVRRQPGVEYLFSGGSPGEKALNLITRKEHRFIYPDCAGKYYIIGRRDWFSRGGSPLARAERTPDGWRYKELGIYFPGNNILLDCPENTFYTTTKRNELFHVRVAPFEIISMKKIKYGENTLDLYRGPKNGDIYLLDEGSWLHRFEGPELKETAVRVARPHSRGNFRIDPLSGRIIVSGLNYLLAYDPETLKVIRKVKNQSTPDHIVIDPGRKLIYGTTLTLNRLLSYDLETLKFRKSAAMPFLLGARFLEYDRRRDLIYVMNYLNGRLMVVAPDGLKVIKTVYLGKKNRSIYLCRGDGMLYVTTWSGAYKIDPDVLLGHDTGSRSNGR